MSSEVQRLVNLVPFLKANQGVSVEEVARVFGVKPARVLSDLAILQFVGLPGGYYGDLFEVDVEGARTDGHIFAHNVDVLGRPMRLSHDRVASLIVALNVVMEMGGDDSAARSALAKLQALSHATPPVEVAVESGDVDVRGALHKALDESRAAALTYRKGGRSELRHAVVEPARLRTDDGFAYLDAWSRERDDWRTFRLDRIVGVEILDEEITVREVPEHLDTWFGDVTHTLTLVVTPRGRWCAEYYPTTSVREVDEGLEVTFPLVSEDWAAHLLLRLGDDVVRVEPESVARKAAELAAAALAHYEDES